VDDYALLDFGSGRRLERWGDVRLARPDPAAAGPPALGSAAWEAADAAFEGRIGGGRWQPVRRPLADRWTIGHAGLRWSVGCAPSGHTGLFPEQAAHWTWMRDALGIRPTTPGVAPGVAPGAAPGVRPEVLNLFAYTGGASIALAAAGARVTHVDASRPAIGWAQANAALNGVDAVRWIQEDARRFVARERRRGRRYDGLLLDPPAFGRGPAGDWQLERDLGELLEAATALLRPDPAFVLVNVYSGGMGAEDLERLLSWALDAAHPALAGRIDAATLDLTSEDGRRLPTGIYARSRTKRTTRSTLPGGRA
jgi:23S rRNA (cytosine1962-C5)-methyltransferase